PKVVVDATSSSVVALRVTDPPTLIRPSVWANTEGAARTNAGRIKIDNRKVRLLPCCDTTARKTGPDDDRRCAWIVGRVLASSMRRNQAVCKRRDLLLRARFRERCGDGRDGRDGRNSAPVETSSRFRKRRLRQRNPEEISSLPQQRRRRVAGPC